MNDHIHIYDTFDSAVFENAKAPLVSLYMPTHLYWTENQQDLIRYKNLVSEVESALSQEYSAQECADVLTSLHDLLNDENKEVWEYAKQGMAVLTDGKETAIYRLDYSVEPLVSVSDTYFIVPLVKNFQYGAHYYLLALSADSFKLFEGDFHTLNELPLPEGTVSTFEELFTDYNDRPSVRVGSYGKPNLNFYGQGSKDDVVDKEVEKFFYYVDKVMTEHFTDVHEYPVIVASLPQHQSLYRKLSSIPNLDKAGIEKPFESMSEKEVLEKASTIIKEVQDAAIMQRIEHLQAGQGKGLAFGDPQSITDALVEKKVAILFIGESTYASGLFDKTTGKSIPQTDNLVSPASLTNEFAIKTYLQGGEVYVVDDERLPFGTGLGALFRY